MKVQGKLIRRSLKTKSFTVAKARLTDLEKDERQRADSMATVATGKMAFDAALATYRKRLSGDASLKPRSKEYREERIAALLKSWAGLEKLDVKKITKADCLDWAAAYQKKVSPTNFNNTVGSLKMILDVAVEAGARYDNPARFIKRAKIKVEELLLPSQENFEKLLALVKHKTCADLIRFLAYGGFRKGEAANILWRDVDLAKGQIAVRGDKDTGTKNSKTRYVPMIPEMRDLMARLQAENQDRQPNDTVMKAKECQASIDSACEKLGIPRFTHHGLRHLYVTRCLECNVNPKVVADWAGHKDGGVLVMNRYGHVRPEHSAEMALQVRFTKPPAVPENVIGMDGAKVA